MNLITLEQAITNKEALILDLRAEEMSASGTMDGAYNIPLHELEERLGELPLEKEVYLLWHTSRVPKVALKALTEAGYHVSIIAGGYPAYLIGQQEEILRDEKRLAEKTREIERSIIKKYRKTIWRGFTRSIRDYQLIQEGDKIACCISGGKDSMLMAKLLQEIQAHGPVRFELEFLCMNPGYNPENWKVIENNAKLMGIPLRVFDSEIFDTVATIDRNPCYLCARMRRGYLYSHAKELGCNKIALGHHYDDVLETILMGMLYGGKIETMMPKLHSTNFEGMELIRPMYMVREADIKSWRNYNDLHFIQCACRFTEDCASDTGTQHSKRDEMTELIRQFRATSDVIEHNIFRSVHNVNLKTIIGYHKDDETYSFLDDYDSKEKIKGFGMHPDTIKTEG